LEKAIFILSDAFFNLIYPPAIYEAIKARVPTVATLYTAQSIRDNLAILNDVTLIFSGWGAPKMDADFLAHAPNLKAVFYGAGSVRGMVTPEFWQRNILLTNAVRVNAEPVAYFAFAEIIFALKGGWHHIKQYATYEQQKLSFPGIIGGTVGIISLGSIGQRVCELLRPLNLKLLLYDPFTKPAQAQALGGELCDLDTIFRECDVVSLHTPLLDETRGMITGADFEMMKLHSTFINTARGAIIREQEMLDVLQKRQDIVAVLDVTINEPPAADSLLWTLPNVILTPHIAGALGAGEIREFGVLMLAELERYLNGEPLQARITQKQFERMG
jgi:phosphoglycerate dehydrogenase-like enzyme